MRADLLALRPESVAALANLGLVKRAQREIAAGDGPELEEDDDGVVTGRFKDGVVTRLPPNTLLRDAPCSCNATTVCRHRVAVALAYPAWRAEGGEVAPKSTELVWSPSCFDDTALLALVGKRLFQRAQGWVRTGLVVELLGGRTPIAKLPTCSVKFHVPKDLAYARCDCQMATGCEHVVVAAWAYRRAEELGSHPPCTIELGAAKTSTADEPLREAVALAEYVLNEGVTNLGPTANQRFSKARVALGSDDYLWLSAILDEIELAVEAYRARSARYRSADVTALLASLEARARAARNGGELPRRFVLGSDEAKETALDHVRLVSLGARVFADGQLRDASVYLADPDSGVVLVTSRRFTFPDGETPEAGPTLARRNVTSRISLGALARGQVVSRALKRQANHSVTFSTTRTGQTSLAPSSGDWSALPEGLRVADFAALAASLRHQPPRLLRPRVLAAGMRVLALQPGAVAKLAYRPGDQEIVARLVDGNGAPVTLRRQHGRAAPRAIDAIARALSGTTPRFVAGDVSLGPFGVEIDPTALVTDKVVVPDLEDEVFGTDSLSGAADEHRSAIDAAIDVAAGVLEEALHDGLLHVRAGFAVRAEGAAAGLDVVGLGGAAKRLRALGQAPNHDAGAAARAWLDAAIRLDLTRDASLVATAPP